MPETQSTLIEKQSTLTVMDFSAVAAASGLDQSEIAILLAGKGCHIPYFLIPQNRPLTRNQTVVLGDISAINMAHQAMGGVQCMDDPKHYARIFNAQPQDGVTVRKLITHGGLERYVVALENAIGGPV